MPGSEDESEMVERVARYSGRLGWGGAGRGRGGEGHPATVRVPRSIGKHLSSTRRSQGMPARFMLKTDPEASAEAFSKICLHAADPPAAITANSVRHGFVLLQAKRTFGSTMLRQV